MYDCTDIHLYLLVVYNSWKKNTSAFDYTQKNLGDDGQVAIG